MASIFYFLLLFILKESPTGTIKVKDHYIDKTEVLNIHWLEYLYHKSQELDSAEVQKLLPDKSNFWYKHPDNRFKPIVLITYEQALAYCVWRSEMVNKIAARKVTYRLPTQAEWREIATELLNIDGKRIGKEFKETQELIKEDPEQYQLFDMENPKRKVYNLYNNVSEMTLKKGVAMGSNNYDLEDPEISIRKSIEYSKPHVYLGFRCVAEWVED